jgi:predicted MFS family arabinose efflux permease
LAILTDFIKPERRGRATSKVTSSFPVVAAIGVPIALEISNYTGHWRLAFLLNIFCQAVIIYFVLKKLPVVNAHLHDLKPLKVMERYKNIVTKFSYLMTILLNVVSFISGFLIIPHIANYFIFNTGFPRDKLGMLYMIGGVCSFFAMRVVGILVDKFTAFKIVSVLAVVAILAIYFEFIHNFKLPALAFMILFMVTMPSRNVIINSLATRIPTSQDRGSFFALFNVANHIGVWLGGFISSSIMHEGANLELVHINYVAMLSIVCIILLPAMIHIIEKYLRKQHVMAEQEIPANIT